jgi:hypothetical protein
MNKGFVLTMDSFLAITFISIIAIVSISLISQISFDTWDDIQLINLTKDEISILKKTNSFQNSILQNSSSPITNELNKTPNKYCFDFEIYEINSSFPLLNGTKRGCSKKSNSIVSSTTTIILNTSNDIGYYIVTINGWYNEV